MSSQGRSIVSRGQFRRFRGSILRASYSHCTVPNLMPKSDHLDPKSALNPPRKSGRKSSCFWCIIWERFEWFFEGGSNFHFFTPPIVFFFGGGSDFGEFLVDSEANGSIL